MTDIDDRTVSDSQMALLAYQRERDKPDADREAVMRLWREYWKLATDEIKRKGLKVN